MTGEQIRASKASAIRYERDSPGELAHMDVKKIGRIPEAAGGAPTAAKTVKPPETAAPRSGDYVHSLVDDHSRLAYGHQPLDAGEMLQEPARREGPGNAWACRWSLRNICTANGIT